MNPWIEIPTVAPASNTESPDFELLIAIRNFPVLFVIDLHGGHCLERLLPFFHQAIKEQFTMKY